MRLSNILVQVVVALPPILQCIDGLLDHCTANNRAWDGRPGVRVALQGVGRKVSQLRGRGDSEGGLPSFEKPHVL